MIISVIGCGSSGQRYLSILKSLGISSELFGLRRNVEAPLAETPYKYNLSDVNFTSYDGSVISKSTHVIISNTSQSHCSTYFWARNLNPHARILIDKPIAINATEFNSLSSTEDLNCFVGFQYRFSPLVKFLKTYFFKMLSESRPMKIFIEHFDDVRSWHPWEDFQNSYSVLPELGGGCFNTLSHALDIAHFIFGSPDNHSLHLGTSSNYISKCDDWYSALLSYKMDSFREYSVSVTAGYFSPFNSFQLRCISDTESLTADFLDDTLAIKRCDRVTINPHHGHYENVVLPEVHRSTLFSQMCKSFICYDLPCQLPTLYEIACYNTIYYDR